MLCKKNVFLRISQKFTGRCLCTSFFFNKVACLRPATLLTKRLWHRWFPVNFAKFVRKHFFTEYLRTTTSVLIGKKNWSVLTKNSFVKLLCNTCGLFCSKSTRCWLEPKKDSQNGLFQKLAKPFRIAEYLFLWNPVTIAWWNVTTCSKSTLRTLEQWVKFVES